MGNGYRKDGKNVYFEARKKAAMYNDTLSSREGAARLLGISAATLTDYERGITKVVPVENVVQMAELYKCPELENGYCKHECPIGRNRPIATEVPRLEGTALQLIKELNADKLQELKESVIDIAADGKISADERDGLREVVQQLKNIQYAISEVVLLTEKELGGKV